MSLWNNLPLRFKIGGTIVTILGLIIYLWRGLEIALVLLAVGIVALLVGFLWKPKEKTASP
jgi:predicted lysophospholipase L1 biosynthesis ABC-type transport system permease subunit